MGAGGQKLARRSIPNMPPGTAVLRSDGPILRHHMLTFAAKLGFALHFETLGTRVPDEGGVQSFYFTNVSAVRGELPLGVLDFLPNRRTLKQGTKHVSDQFTYSSVSTEEKRHAVFYAVFNDSFSIMAVSALDRTEFLDAHAGDHPVFAPGAFRR